jgi:hypothetical protein
MISAEAAMPADTLYEEDIVAWAEQQAEAIRELARTRPDLSNAVDWNNLAEEMDSLGRTETRAFTGPLRQFLIHLAKALSSRTTSMRGWRSECLNFQGLAREAFTNSLRQKVNLDQLWSEALRQADAALAVFDETLAGDLPRTCPLSLDELIDRDMDLDRAIAIVSGRIGRARSEILLEKDETP